MGKPGKQKEKRNKVTCTKRLYWYQRSIPRYSQLRGFASCPHSWHLICMGFTQALSTLKACGLDAPMCKDDSPCLLWGCHFLTGRTCLPSPRDNILKHPVLSWAEQERPFPGLCILKGANKTDAHRSLLKNTWNLCHLGSVFRAHTVRATTFNTYSCDKQEYQTQGHLLSCVLEIRQNVFRHLEGSWAIRSRCQRQTMPRVARGTGQQRHLNTRKTN